MYHALKTNGFAKYYFTSGSLLYILLAMMAFVSSYKAGFNPVPHIFEPMDYFYMAIIIECLVFSYGLGHKIRLLYFHEIEIQNELDSAQNKIQQQLLEKIDIQQKENQILIEQKQKQELITKVAYLQQKVLRSQINSHFIFNVLNSIKLFILENDSQKASLYLGKFVNFIRKVLDESLTEVSNLQEELETLELYLSIEKMRFENKFKYKIDITNDINLTQYPFPPLLLQPFVENALWHGIMQIEKDGILLVKVQSDNDNITVEVDDNGIGYNNSIKKNKEHTSHGLRIVNERIEQYNLNGNYQIEYEITDKSEIGKGPGTHVLISLNKIINESRDNNN